MKAILLTEPGSPTGLRLEEAIDPRPGRAK